MGPPLMPALRLHPRAPPRLRLRPPPPRLVVVRVAPASLLPRSVVRRLVPLPPRPTTRSLRRPRRIPPMARLPVASRPRLHLRLLPARLLRCTPSRRHASDTNCSHSNTFLNGQIKAHTQCAHQSSQQLRAPTQTLSPLCSSPRLRDNRYIRKHYRANIGE